MSNNIVPCPRCSTKHFQRDTLRYTCTVCTYNAALLPSGEGWYNFVVAPYGVQVYVDEIRTATTVYRMEEDFWRDPIAQLNLKIPPTIDKKTLEKYMLLA